MTTHPIAVAPASRPRMFEALAVAVSEGGGDLVGVDEAQALIWADPASVDDFPAIIARGTGIRWIQLPYAGIEPFAHHLDREHLWTCGKGVYATPVAEHVVTLALAGLRGLHRYIPATEWAAPIGTNLVGATVAIIGGGGIASELIRLLTPFDVAVRVVRRRPEPLLDAVVYAPADRFEAVRGAHLVVIACALTAETTGIVDHRFLAAMDPNAWLVNVGRGGHVVVDDLLTALDEGTIAGAALDVTDPEPLPAGHPLWTAPHCIITPHVANTPEMGLPLLADRVRDNVARWCRGDELIGLVDPVAGY
ncbi:MAG: hydroxyacid dehydrogenase [Acidimicrobiia bacterium]|nr:hydroxyacid dehydrogenase [Acidimicrobiia bacterium]